jgi:hypothetical protein
VLPRVHFSDGLQVVLGEDRVWIWYGAGEGNPEAPVSFKEFHKYLMIFAFNIDRLDSVGVLEEKPRPFGWSFQGDGSPCHMSLVTLDWPEESVDLIVGWPANSLNLSPSEFSWAILENLVRRIKPGTIEELKNVLTAAWALILQSTIDRFCEGSGRRLELCLANGGESISNRLWQEEWHRTKDSLEGNRFHIP